MLKAFGIGVVMAVMLLWMLHERIMLGSLELSWGIAAFLAAHVGVAAAIVSISLIGPRVRVAVVAHRPSFTHVVGMATGMILTATSVHVVVHAGLV